MYQLKNQDRKSEFYLRNYDEKNARQNEYVTKQS